MEPPYFSQKSFSSHRKEEEMIEPKAKDIGRAVVYRPKFGAQEDCVITSYNDRYVFVRYQKQHPGANGQATLREDLEWLCGTDAQ